jgi:tetratricopeptide (TPR) repeat protein
VEEDLVWSVMVGAEHVADVLGDRTLQGALLERVAPLAINPGREAEYRERHARLLANTDRLDEALAAAEGGIGLGADRDESLGVLVGQILVWSGDVREAISRLEVICSTGNASPAAHRMLGVAYAEVQEYSQAQSHLGKAIEALRSSDDAEGTAGVLSMIGTVYAEQGHFEEAVNALVDALAIARSIGFRKAEAECLVNLATIKAIGNRPGSALELFDEAASAFAAIGHRRGSALVHVNMASLLRDFVGDLDEARRLATSAYEFFHETGDFLRQATCEAVLAGIDALEEPMRGIGRYEALAGEVANRDMDWLARQVEESLVRLLVQENRIPEARTRLDALLDSSAANEGNPAVDLATKALEAMVLSGEGHDAEARDRALLVLDEVDAATPDGYRLAYSAFVSLGSDRAHRHDRLDAISLAHDLLEAALADLGEAQAARGRSVALHRSIEDAHRTLVPRHGTAEVAPIGTVPVKGQTERVVATVTVFHPDDLAIHEPVARRRAQLRRLLDEIESQRGQPSIKVLAKLLDTSQATIKRDLSAIRKPSNVGETGQ